MKTDRISVRLSPKKLSDDHLFSVGHKYRSSDNFFCGDKRTEIQSVFMSTLKRHSSDEFFSNKRTQIQSVFMSDTKKTIVG